MEDARPTTGRASVLLTCRVDTLLDPDSTTPAWVLSTLTGRMRVTSEVARRWVDTHGADTRVVVLDDGDVVGGRPSHPSPTRLAA